MQTAAFFPMALSPSPNPTGVVVLPSPAGVGLIAVTRIKFPSGLSFKDFMNFNPKKDKAEAGVSIFQKDDNYINFTVFKNEEKIFIKTYAFQNDKIISVYEQEIVNYKGKIKLKISSEEGEYKFLYSTRGFRYRLFTKIKNDIVKSVGYTGAHIGLYATSNGDKSNDYADFDYIDYTSKDQKLSENIK